MTDGFRVPGQHDGMAAFPGSGDEVILMRNHEQVRLSQRLVALPRKCTGFTA